MTRPRFHLTPDDWFDTLDWLEYQLSRPDWLVAERHPVHQQGLAYLTERVHQYRYVQTPTHPDCDALQTLLEQSLERPDWDRLRKTLSARRRRRRERRLAQSPVNLTLSTQAHHWLKQLARAGQFNTLSEALAQSLPSLVSDIEQQAKVQLEAKLTLVIENWLEFDLIRVVDSYLNQAKTDRRLATACRIAFHWHQRDPDRHKANMLKERYIEDLVWNEIHLGRPALGFLQLATDDSQTVPPNSSN